MSLALELAKRICSMRYEQLPATAITNAKIGVLDTLAVTVAGSSDASTQAVRKLVALGASGSSVVFGHDMRVSALDAALINGTAAHALDFDDCNSTLAGHPSVPVLPGLFALADQEGAGGREFITAYVAGFETECKVSLGVNLYQYVKGWHPTATLGVFGAAAAAAHLMSLTEEQTATALSIAVSMSAGIKSNFGTMTKPLHVGQCARNGLFAAMLARAGFTANHQAFEHKQGYFNVFNGEGNYQIAKILPQWADPLDIVQPGIALKQYPCCASTHPAIDALLELVNEHDLKPQQVLRIDSYIHPRRLEHTDRPDPRSSVDARFSIQYVLSRALAERCVIGEHFQGDAYADSNIRALMQRVRAAPYTTDQFPPENHFGAEVRLVLDDGTMLSRKLEQAYGRSSPLPPDKLKAKFERCIDGIIDERNITPLYDSIQKLEQIADVRVITTLLTTRHAVRSTVGEQAPVTF